MLNTKILPASKLNCLCHIYAFKAKTVMWCSEASSVNVIWKKETSSLASTTASYRTGRVDHNCLM